MCVSSFPLPRWRSYIRGEYPGYSICKVSGSSFTYKRHLLGRDNKLGSSPERGMLSERIARTRKRLNSRLATSLSNRLACDSGSNTERDPGGGFGGSQT